MSQAISVDVDRVVDVVTAAPGLTYAEVARRLRLRRADALEHVRAAVAAGQVHEGPTTVRARGGSRRSGPVGLFPEPPDVDDQVLPFTAEALRALREGTGVTLDALARQLGVSRFLVHRWEASRQPMPAWAARDLLAALEDAQTSDAPTRGRDVRRRRELVAEVQRRVKAGESTTRHQLAPRSVRDLRLLEQARRAGELHEAPTWIRAGWSRHEGLALFPGPRPRRVAGTTVKVAELDEARRAAGWSHVVLGWQIGQHLEPVNHLAGTTMARWLRELEVVPGWASGAAAKALTAARAARKDEQGAVLAAITAEPGLSRKALLARLGYTRSPITQRHVDALIAAGALHERFTGRRGQWRGLYPGPAPAEVLTGETARMLRRRAGLTQRELAAAVGTHVQAVRDWERGARRIPFEWQRRLSEHLEALPAGKPPRLRRAGLLDAGELRPALLEAIRTHRGLTRHQVEKLGLAGSRREMDRALAALEGEGLIHHGRVGAGVVEHGPRERVSRGRAGYLPGPDPSA